MKTAHDIILKPVITEAMQGIANKSTPFRLLRMQTRSNRKSDLQNCLA